MIFILAKQKDKSSRKKNNDHWKNSHVYLHLNENWNENASRQRTQKKDTQINNWWE